MRQPVAAVRQSRASTDEGRRRTSHKIATLGREALFKSAQSPALLWTKNPNSGDALARAEPGAVMVNWLSYDLGERLAELRNQLWAFRGERERDADVAVPWDRRIPLLQSIALEWARHVVLEAIALNDAPFGFVLGVVMKHR